MLSRVVFGLVAAAVLGVLEPCEAAAPPPDRSIIIGAYYVPHPSFVGAAFDWQYIADAGMDAAIAVARLDYNHRLETLWQATQCSSVTAAANTTPPLWYIVQRRNSGDYPHCGTFEDHTPTLSEVNTIMNNAAYLYADNIYGWNTWDEPNSVSRPLSSRLDSLIRLTIEDLGADSTWTTHVGWFRPGDEAGMRRMLELLDGHDGVGWGRRPVFGVMSYRYMRTSENCIRVDTADVGFGRCYPSCADAVDANGKCLPNCGAFSLKVLNSGCSNVFSIIREPARLHSDAPNRYPWWSVVHVTDEEQACYSDVGPPSEAALRADVFTRLAWGAKGIFYYTWMRCPDDANWDDDTDWRHWPGVYESSSTFNDVRDYITTVNADVRSIRDYLGPAEVKRPVLGQPVHNPWYL